MVTGDGTLHAFLYGEVGFTPYDPKMSSNYERSSDQIALDALASSGRFPILGSGIKSIASAVQKSIFASNSTRLFGASVRGQGQDEGFIVGAFLGFTGGDAYIFENQGGTLVEIFHFDVQDLGIDEPGDGEFGRDVGWNGDVVIVGSQGSEAIPAVGNNNGAAWVLRRITGVWTPIQRIQSPAPADGREFSGRGVCIADDPNGRFICCAERSPGQIHLYREGPVDTWTFEQTFGARAYTTFNGSLDAQPGMFIAGATGEGVGGSAFVYEDPTGGGTFTETQLVPTIAVPAGASFGFRTAIHGDFAMCGATGENSGDGAVYFFERTAPNTWAAIGREDNTVASGSLFGNSVGIRDLGGGNAVAYAASNGNEEKDMRIFDYNGTTWTRRTPNFIPDPTEVGEALGDMGGMITTLAMVGAPLNDEAGSIAGKCYIAPV